MTAIRVLEAAKISSQCVLKIIWSISLSIARAI